MGISFDLEWILVIGTLFFGVVLLYYFFIGNKRLPPNLKQMPLLLDLAKTFFPFLVLILLLRSFVAEPFRIPSGSMIPTLEIGDFILVKKYSYGIRLPIVNLKIMDIGKPMRGDVAVFRYPVEPRTHYIKRVIGLPGDHIEWTSDKRLIINGEPVKVLPSEDYAYKDRAGETRFTEQYTEFLTDKKLHQFIVFPNSTRPGKWDVPKGHYFMMGDNRDKSSDSRFWGFVPESNLVGKASLVWLHWNWSDKGDGFQSKRIGASVN